MTKTTDNKIDWEELNDKIMKIRGSWGEISEYCQDEIMDAFGDFLTQAIEEEREKFKKEISKLDTFSWTNTQTGDAIRQWVDIVGVFEILSSPKGKK